MPGLRKIDKDLQGDQSSNKGRTGGVFSAQVVSPPRWRSDATGPGPEDDASMAKSGAGITAVLGSLSHGHFNCGCRNILCAKPGCLCVTRGGGDSTRDGGDSDKQCSCKASPILDANGNYSMDKVKAHDPTWHELCLTGIKWEVLSWKMDVEEPDVALIISNALNN